MDRISFLVNSLRRESSPHWAPIRRAVGVFCRHLDQPGPERPLTALWEQELSALYGDLGPVLCRNNRVDPDALGRPYGVSCGGGLTHLLQGILTAYGVIVRLLALDFLAPGARYPWRQLLDGSCFRRLGRGCCDEEDWCCWLLARWDAELSDACTGLRGLLEGLPGSKAPERPEAIQALYQQLLPQPIRHALGEFYTPPWMAELMVEEALRRWPSPRRVLDPTCGGGVFLLAALRAAPGCDLTGLDINAFAVLGARTALLFAGGNPRSVLHCDLLALPQWEGNVLVVEDGAGGRLQLSREAVDEVSRRGLDAPLEDVCRLCGLPPPEDTADRVRARMLLNRVLSAALAPANLLIGNFPWVSWEYLSPAERQRALPLWRRYGLFPHRKIEKSFANEDISALMLCLCLDRLVIPGGAAAVVLRQALFKSQRNGASFRRFQAGDTPFCVVRLDDFSALQPFRDVAVAAAAAYLETGRPQRYDVPCFLWGGQVNRLMHRPGATAAEVSAAAERTQALARPSEAADPCSGWIIVRAEEADSLRGLLGSNPYRARSGVFTGGANGVYCLRILGRSPGGVLVRNLSGQGKRQAAEVTAEIEPDHLYPLVRGSDLHQWSVRPSSYLLCPHTAQTRQMPVDGETLRARSPLTWAYLCRFREVLDQRRGFAGWEKFIQQRQFHAILRVGAYTFSPYKVAWRYISKRFFCAVLSPWDDPYLGHTIPLPNEKLMYLPVECEEEAYYLCGVLSFTAVRRCVEGYMNPTSISAHVVEKLAIPPFDPASPLHVEIARQCRLGHLASTEKERLQVQQCLDQLAQALYP